MSGRERDSVGIPSASPIASPYSAPSARELVPPPLETDTGGAQDMIRGDEDFAGFHEGRVAAGISQER